MFFGFGKSLWLGHAPDKLSGFLDEIAVDGRGVREVDIVVGL